MTAGVLFHPAPPSAPWEGGGGVEEDAGQRERRVGFPPLGVAKDCSFLV